MTTFEFDVILPQNCQLQKKLEKYHYVFSCVPHNVPSDTKLILLTLHVLNIWLVPRKCAKIDFPSQTQKLCSSNKNRFDKNVYNENVEFSWISRLIAKTRDTVKSVHFLWWYPHEAIKALYYVSEFKCLKDIRHQKPVLGPCLSYKILRISLLNWLMVLPCARISMIDLSAWVMQFLKGNPCDSPKNWTLWSFLSLFLGKYSVLNLFLVFAHMQFPILDYYIHTSRHRKRSI